MGSDCCSLPGNERANVNYNEKNATKNVVEHSFGICFVDRIFELAKMKFDVETKKPNAQTSNEIKIDANR